MSIFGPENTFEEEKVDHLSKKFWGLFRITGGPFVQYDDISFCWDVANQQPYLLFQKNFANSFFTTFRINHRKRTGFSININFVENRPYYFSVNGDAQEDLIVTPSTYIQGSLCFFKYIIHFKICGARYGGYYEVSFHRIN